MKMKFKFVSWQGFKKEVTTIYRLGKKDKEELEKLTAKRETEKLRKFIERLNANAKMSEDTKTTIGNRIRTRINVLEGTKHFNSFDKVKQKALELPISPQLVGKRTLSLRSYKIFLNFLFQIGYLLEKREAMNLENLINILEGKTEAEFVDGLSSLIETFSFDEGSINLYSYSGDKKILSIINVLVAINNAGVINNIEKILYVNKSVSNTIEKYVDKYVEKIFIETRCDEFNNCKVSTRAVAKAACVHWTYKILCNVSYQAALKSAVLVVC